MDSNQYTEDGPPKAGEPLSAVEVRSLRFGADLTACVALQEAIWGRGFKDLVPASILHVTQKVGGIVAGAFTGNQELAGFVFGLTGARDGKPTHWSHMLGVRPEFRGRGVGRLLKEYQRKCLLERGVTEMQWTFDPLVAANAHFNLNVLGARVLEYVPDMYGKTGSSLHTFGTDRVVVQWSLDRVRGNGVSRHVHASSREAPIVNDPAIDGEEDASSGRLRRKHLPDRELRIEIPGDIFAVRDDDPSHALAWRISTRKAFMAVLEEGFEVLALGRDQAKERAHYILKRMDRDGRGAP